MTATQVKERPVLFAGEMVRAILDGRKTQTRRVVKLRKPGMVQHISPYPDFGRQWFASYTDAHDWSARTQGEEVLCPYGVPGDRLWVREKWAMVQGDDGGEYIHYDADDGVRGVELDRETLQNRLGAAITDEDFIADHALTIGHAWKPSIHMPRWASRLLLEITEVRVERVQAISYADAIDEGVDWHACPRVPMPSRYGRAVCREKIDYVGGFRKLWDSINDARGFGWDENPWVWAVTFKRINEATAGPGATRSV